MMCYFTGDKIRNIATAVLQMEQVLHSIRGVVGDGGADTGEPCQEKQHDGEPPAAGDRYLQVLRGQDDLLLTWLLVPVHTGYQE